MSTSSFVAVLSGPYKCAGLSDSACKSTSCIAVQTKIMAYASQKQPANKIWLTYMLLATDLNGMP